MGDQPFREPAALMIRLELRGTSDAEGRPRTIYKDTKILLANPKLTEDLIEDIAKGLVRHFITEIPELKFRFREMGKTK